MTNLEILGVDTSWLIAVSVATHPKHAFASAQKELIRTEGLRFGIPILVLSEFVHIITDTRRFVQPLTMTEAISEAENWWSANDVDQMYPTSESVSNAWKWMSEFKLGRKRILDTQLAAIYWQSQVKQLLTLNFDDFGVFGKFKLFS